MPKKTHPSRLHKLMRGQRIIRARDMEAMGMTRKVIRRMVARGELVQRSRGIYTTPDHEATRHTDMAEVCARVPKAIVCLISALEFHELTTQIPHAVWIMIDRAGRRPAITRPSVEIVHASGEALTAGVEIQEIEGVRVRMTNPAKTVVDCFRYRRRVGLDVAMEAMRDCWKQRKATMDEIYRYTRIGRVANVMRPYMEAICA